MKLNKLLLFAAAGVVAYKVLSRVKVVKVDFPEELPQELTLATDVIREVYGKNFAKGIEKAIKDNENKTNIKMDEKLVEVFSEHLNSKIQDATDEAAKLIREYKEVSE